MKITFKNVSKIELTIDSSGRGSVKISCPIEGTNDSEIELFFKSCDFEISNNEIIIKNLYTENSYPAVIAGER